MRCIGRTSLLQCLLSVLQYFPVFLQFFEMCSVVHSVDEVACMLECVVVCCSVLQRVAV